MSSYIVIPDAIVFPDGTIRLVTSAAKSWAYSNTDIKNSCTESTVPDYVDYEDSVAPALEDDGFVVKRDHIPVGHYLSKRRRWPKATISNDGNVIDFLQRIPKQCRDDAMRRAYAKNRKRHHDTQESAKRTRKPRKRRQTPEVKQRNSCAMPKGEPRRGNTSKKTKDK